MFSNKKVIKRKKRKHFLCTFKHYIPCLKSELFLFFYCNHCAGAPHLCNISVRFRCRHPELQPRILNQLTEVGVASRWKWPGRPSISRSVLRPGRAFNTAAGRIETLNTSWSGLQSRPSLKYIQGKRSEKVKTVGVMLNTSSIDCQ